MSQVESMSEDQKIQSIHKKCFFAVDGTVSTAILLTPPEAGPDTCWGGSRLFWDCKLELNFVPALMISGTRLG
jgi:hypothetical protein